MVHLLHFTAKDVVFILTLFTELRAQAVQSITLRGPRNLANSLSLSTAGIIHIKSGAV